MKRVVKVSITGYYLISDDLPDDVLGTASFDEFVEHELASLSKPGAYDAEDVLELVEEMLQDMKTLPTIRLELKKD